jgi:CRP-like cAMP-binding protein
VPLSAASEGRHNRLLGALPAGTYEQIAPSLRSIDLQQRQVVFAPGEPIDWVYFPVSGLVSIILGDAAGRALEITAVGREGALGVASVLTSAPQPPTEVLQQVPGRAVRLRSAEFADLTEAQPHFRRVIDRYIAARLAEVTQGSACLRLHGLEARAARWLLTTRDRVEAAEFPFTHELFALMLSSSRPKVSRTLALLRGTGAIAYGRGVIWIVDQAALEALACDCYGIIRDATLAGAWT